MKYAVHLGIAAAALLGAVSTAGVVAADQRGAQDRIHWFVAMDHAGRR